MPSNRGVIQLRSLLMLKRRTMQVQRSNVKEDLDSKMEERVDASFVAGLVLILDNNGMFYA